LRRTRAAHPAAASRRGGSDGAVVAEFAVVVPALVLLLLGIFQFAAWSLAGEVALGAAQEGARAARLRGGSAADGEAAAWRFIDQANGGHLVRPQVRVTRGADDVRVEIGGRAQSLVPGLDLPVRETAAGEVERFRGEGEG
jgi:Flp pilus assembly protein TadG